MTSGRSLKLLVEITSLYLHPSEASTSVLSAAQDVLRWQEIVSHLCFKDIWRKQISKLGFSAAQHVASMPAHWIFASSIYSSLLLSAEGTYLVNMIFAPWPAWPLSPNPCSGAILCWYLFCYQRSQKHLSIFYKVPLNFALSWTLHRHIKHHVRSGCEPRKGLSLRISGFLKSNLS